MKKIIQLILILSLFISCKKELNIQPKYSSFETDLEARNLFGKVKEFSQLRANFQGSDKNQTEKPIINLKENFTEYGSLQKSEYFDVFGKTEQTTENFYDGNGYLLKQVNLNEYYPQKMVEELIDSDSINRTESRQITINDTLTYKFIMKFDEHNNTKQQIKIEKNDTLIVNFKYKYDSNKNLIESEQVDKNNSSINKFKYDENGNIVELLFETEYLKIKKVTNFKNNRITKIENYNISADSKQHMENVTEFDNYYNPINDKIYQNSTLNREIKNEYEFDNTGNWIKKTVYLKEHFANSNEFVPAYIETREIEYWK